MAADAAAAHRPLVLDPAAPSAAAAIAELRARPGVEVTDLRAPLRAELAEIPDTPPPAGDRWVYYPWRNRLLGLPAEQEFRAVRLNRNRNKLTAAEQAVLAELRIGVVGQSVGHAVAYALAQEGVCGALRLADFDAIALSNLNRVPATLFDIGVNKAVVTARRIAELDPYLPVEVCTGGVDAESVAAFMAGLSLVVEECDSLDVKLLVREHARTVGLPVIMETSDRGLLDVERYDLEPEREPFHGMLGGVKAADLRGLASRDKAPYVMGILGADQISARMGASMVEIDETLAAWPQLGSEVMLGGALVAAAVRRIGLGGALPSGRVRIDLETELDRLAAPGAQPASAAEPDELDPHLPPAGATDVERVLHCARRAPSGGNAQPWTLSADGDEIRIALRTDYRTALDHRFRGSAVALGAALYNARAAAAALGILGSTELRESDSGGLIAKLRLGRGTDPALAADYPWALRRETNRRLGAGGALDGTLLAELRNAATAEGAVLRIVDEQDALAEAAAILAGSDRVRYLEPALHGELFAEVRAVSEDLTTGIDVRSLELAPDEQVALEVARRPDIMANLRDWSGGAALGDSTRDRVLAAAALLVLTVPSETADGPGLTGYARGGAAAERVWIAAQRAGLAVQPISPVFLYARDVSELAAISPGFVDTLTSLQGRFLHLVGVPERETMALALRVSRAADATVRSRRRPLPGVDTSS
ncbi:Rv1355c family protein [Nocardia sp. NPDC057353]|uniref:Rv1355c family protein n=1 Tax=Nocardia sp. NPDC057353 TaxID=3346104 RepID=UPI00364153D1